MLVLHEIARGLAGVACAALFVAASRERGGDRPGARRLARRAGLASAAATLGQILLAPWLPWSAGHAPRLALSEGAAVAAAAVALLAGLSGKPRPSCWFAAALWIAAVAWR